MNRFKKTQIYILLVAVTLAVVLLPMAINSLANSGRMGDSESWNYNAPESKITSRQVAELYYRGEIKAGLHIEYSGEESKQEAQKSLKLMAEKIFGESTTAEYILSLSENSDIYYSRESILVTVDGLPVALNFFNCIIYSKGITLEVFYEEKTNTLMGFSHTFMGDEAEMDNPLYPRGLYDEIAKYYGSISIDRDEYYFYEETDGYNTATVTLGLTNKTTEDPIEEDNILF